MDTTFFKLNNIPYADVQIKSMIIYNRERVSEESYSYFEPIDDEGNINLKEVFKNYNEINTLHMSLKDDEYFIEEKAEFATSIKIVGMYLNPFKDGNSLRDKDAIQRRNEAMAFLDACKKIENDPYNGKTHDEWLLDNEVQRLKESQALYDADYYGHKSLGKSDADFDEMIKKRQQDYEKRKLDAALRELDPKDKNV